ncbi:hypothetical protein SKAU_G00377420 [Synaphobranchus kaupii]|uniref:Uncharacterized protein n=1 Tax=Synaphobranchus kaupii TaxID=118154 RepID=A0A9Q1ECY8_SYNKA|nr:hypothetical protein SKAU_G00377420 [Synaphobranchus kaupii]
MADPIMDLLDDTPLFSLDSLPESFTQGSSDPVEEALKLALGHQLQVSMATAMAVQSAAQGTIPVVSSAGPTTVLLGSPLTTSHTQQTAPKIVILKGPQGQTQVLQGVAAGGGSPAGKLTIARVLTGTPLRPGMSIVSGGTVLNAAPGQVKVGTGVQRLVQSPNGPLKQVLLTSMPQTQVQLQTQAQPQVQLQAQMQQQLQLQAQTQPQLQTVQVQPQSAALRPQGVTLTTVPQQRADPSPPVIALSLFHHCAVGRDAPSAHGGIDMKADKIANRLQERSAPPHDVQNRADRLPTASP